MAPLDINPNELEPYWVPFTPNRSFKKRPRLFSGAKGMHYFKPDGSKVIDATSGLFCVNAGHCREPIVKAIQEMAAKLDYSPAFQYGHPKVFELASRLSLLAPGDLDYAFFTNSGSEAVDTALKIALAYHKARGEGARTRFIGRERGYHGIGFGGISVGGMVANRKQFGNMLAGVDHLQSTYDRSKQAFTKGEPEWGAHLADELTRLVNLHDASTIAAVIVEPVAGSTGILPPPKGYLEKLREITAQHGILLIFDEVITGFGRLGHCFASERYGVDARHDHLRQGHHQCRRADGGRDGVQEDLRRLHDRAGARGGAVPRLHLLGPSAGRRRRPRHARHLQGRGPVRARQGAGAGVRRRHDEPQGSAQRGGHPHRRPARRHRPRRRSPASPACAATRPPSACTTTSISTCAWPATRWWSPRR